jgi:two-component system, OmpR family, sensor histidine kinase TctE
VIRLRTLRGRLIAAMLAILAIAVGLTTALDRLTGAGAPTATEEPYQDALVLALFTLPALILVWFISSWSLSPLARISQQARAIGPRNATTRLSPAGLPAEIVPLVDAVNGALDRMTEAFETERRFTENAAHELRTPLAILDLRLQRARHTEQFDWPAIDRDLAQLNRLVTQMLDLARKESAARRHHATPRQEVNLARLAREACASILPLAEAQNRRISITLPDNLPIPGDADSLRDALRNLLENASIHGAGVITLQAHAENDSVVLRISDEGPGLPPSEAQAAFERFTKSTRSPGTGLGLAIVREVVHAHGGTVGFVPDNLCCVEMRIPREAAVLF